MHARLMRDENTKDEMDHAIGGISRRLLGELLCSVHLENSKAIYLTHLFHCDERPNQSQLQGV